MHPKTSLLLLLQLLDYLDVPTTQDYPLIPILPSLRCSSASCSSVSTNSYAAFRADSVEPPTTLTVADTCTVTFCCEVAPFPDAAAPALKIWVTTGPCGTRFAVRLTSGRE